MWSYLEFHVAQCGITFFQAVFRFFFTLLCEILPDSEDIPTVIPIIFLPTLSYYGNFAQWRSTLPSIQKPIENKLKSLFRFVSEAYFLSFYMQILQSNIQID